MDFTQIGKRRTPFLRLSTHIVGIEIIFIKTELNVNIDVDVDVTYNIDMNKEDILNWLLTSKNMSERSAKDVLSRCNRIIKLNNNTDINLIDYETFINSKLFLTQTMFIKSQLKRAFTLYKEFEASR